MNAISMFNVIPVTGPHQGQGRICYICELGSAPVAVAFIKPQSAQGTTLLEAIQKLYEKHRSLQAFIVFLATSEEGLKQKLRALAEEKKLTVPLTVLPEGGLPDSIPVSPEAENAVLLYRGRQIVKKLENVNFETPFFFPPGSSSNLIGLSANAPLDSPPTALGVDAKTPLDSSATFMELDEAAADMLSRP